MEEKELKEWYESPVTFIWFIVGSIIIIAFCMWCFPIYNVWQKALAGEAELRQAEWNRQIAVQEAQAKRESAISLAQAEIERAKGVAKANEIIGQSLKENEAYLRYLWIQGMLTNQMQVVYVPTEANLPILEASRWNQLRIDDKKSNS